MMFITFSGIDGSGKSTQTKLLQDRLVREGKKVAYFHAVEFSLANKLHRLLKGKKEFTAGSEQAVTEASGFGIFLREQFLYWDLLRFNFLRRKLKRQGYDYLLSDRSFFDSLINLAYLRQSADPPVWLEKLLPNVDYAFFLALDPVSILTRTRVPDQGLAYLQAKQALFQRKASEWHFIVLPAADTPENIAEKIWQTLSAS